MTSLKINSFARFVVLCGLLVFLNQATSHAQTTAKRKPQPKFSLVVTEGSLLALSVKSDKVPLKNIGAELAKKLKAPVLIGKSIEQLEVSVDYKKMPLEPALQLLAPKVFIDYEVNSAPGVQPRAVGIYLNGHDDPDPAINAVVSNRSEAIVIEGNTEEPEQTVSTAPEDLRVSFDQNGLTVEAKRQPLTVVAYRIANEIGVPLELKWESTDLIDLKFSKLSVEEAMARLSPQVRLYVRADLQNLERKPFRMVVVRPEKSS